MYDVKFLQAGEHGGVGICYTYRSRLLLLACPQLPYSVHEKELSLVSWVLRG